MIESVLLMIILIFMRIRISFFPIVLNLDVIVNLFCFLQFLFDILPIGSGFVDPHTFADPDPGRYILADPTDSDPNPKHWIE